MPTFASSRPKSIAALNLKRSVQNRAAKNLQKAARALSSRSNRKKTPSVSKLTKSVARLKVATQGKQQMDRQYAEWATNLPAGILQSNSITSLRPMCFLHQAISEDANIHSVNPQIGVPSIGTYIAGIWIKQPFPITEPIASGGDGFPASANKYDQLQYWSQSDGVQNQFYHTSTEYTMNFVGQGCTGYVDVFLVHPKKSYVPTNQQDISLPQGLVGFTHMSLGDPKEYQINSQYFSCKRLRRKYFNTAAPAGGQAAEERELQTNPNFDIKFRVVNAKSRRLIKAPEVNTGQALLDESDIPFRKQDWIIISSTINNRDSSDDNFILLRSMHRTCHWRDYQGAST